MRKVLSIACILLFISSCNWSSSQKNDAKDLSEATELNLKKENADKIKKVFYILPSPIETSLLIAKSGVHFRSDLMNSADNLSGYSTSISRSIALGVYCADLSYAALNEQYQISIEYINVARNLAESLGVLRTVEQGKIKMLENNLMNKKLIVDIVSEIYMESSEQLREQDRYILASLMLIGGWIESLYLATQSTDIDELRQQIVVQKILEQRLSLEAIKNVLGENKDDLTIAPIYKDILELEILFEKSIKSTNKDLDFYDKYDRQGFRNLVVKIEEIREYMIN
nr:hypothetical protein [uncultured Marinifilum sp.]